MYVTLMDTPLSNCYTVLGVSGHVQHAELIDTPLSHYYTVFGLSGHVRDVGRHPAKGNVHF